MKLRLAQLKTSRLPVVAAIVCFVGLFGCRPNSGNVSILLSGAVFPFDGMPRVAQWLAQALPLTHYNVIVRGITLRDAALDELVAPLLKLLAIFAVLLLASLGRFRRRLL